MGAGIPLALGPAASLLGRGGVVIWVIAALSVVTLALIFWKAWRLSLAGAWSGVAAREALVLWLAGERDAAVAKLAGRRGIRAQFIAALFALQSGALSEEARREEATRLAKRALAEAREGLRGLELIATIAPLLGLLGTVLGMIAAFQALQASGTNADPSTLAGGIWVALLTTAAGMSVAIPASVALSWFESVIDRVRQDMEDMATQLFVGATR